MSIFIQETARSFPNIDEGGVYQKEWERPASGNYESHANHSGPGTGYRITFNDDGPGTTVFGNDRVYYIGDNDEQCFGAAGTPLEECDFNRQPVFRWYRSGGNNDHKYTPRGALRWPTDFTGEQVGQGDGGDKVARSYNREPRNGEPVFFLSRAEKPGKTTAVHVWYENSKNDTQLVANNNTNYTPGAGGGPGGGYVYIEVLGYVYNSQADAALYADSGETPVPLYEYYRSSSTSEKDHFYTANPAGEVNLERVNGVPDCKSPRDEEYDYVGIVGWCFAKDTTTGNRKVYADVGLIGPIGYSTPVDYATRSGWYEWEGPDLGGHPSVGGSAAIYTHENYEYQFDADAGYLRQYDQDGQMVANGGGVFNYSYFRSNRLSGSYSTNRHPAVGWGDPQICPIDNRDAYFEWVYGKNGAVKAAVPKYLEFHAAFDSQFFYYVYNTTYPWNGPIFSVQYSISNRNQCPNKNVPGTAAATPADDRCVCDEALVSKEYHSHFYEIRPDSWRTTNTSLSLTDFQHHGMNECFKVCDTESHTLLFRYVDGGVDRFAEGDTINGWEIGEHAYFGNKLRCGYMELIGDGDAFTEGQIFTPNGRDPANIEVIAGYGVGDRAAFFGVYEFPKKLSYYKVEIDRDALIHSKTLDQAELSAKVSKDGRISSIIIENAGFGYKNPSVVIQDPLILNEYGAMDLTREVTQQFKYEDTKFRIPEDHIENYDGDDYDYNLKRISKKAVNGLNRDSSKRMQKRENDYPYASNSDVKIEGMDEDEKQTTLTSISIRDKKLKTTSSEDRRRRLMKPAKLEVSKLDANGAIQEITIVDRGAGYDPDPDNPPRIFVAEVEEEEYKMRGPNTKKGQKAFKETVSPEKRVENIRNSDIDPKTGRYRSSEIKTKSLKEAIAEKSDLNTSQLGVLDDGTLKSMQTMMNGFNATYPTGYIKIGEIDEVEKTALCQGIPKECVKITVPRLATAALPNEDDFEFLVKNSTAFAQMFQTTYSEATIAAKAADGEMDKLSDFYGWNNGQECIVIPQPKFYNVTRFKDLPCPYLDEETGKAFGFIVYKYCASKGDNGAFKVTLSTRGKTIGPDGENFMAWMHKLDQPSVTKPRPVTSGGVDNKNCWKCTRNITGSMVGATSGITGSVEGRCYWDPSGGNDVVFVPIGLDENTYDWQHADYSELTQLSVWLGENIESYRTRSLTYTTPDRFDTTTTTTTNEDGSTSTSTSTVLAAAGQTNNSNVYYTASIKRLQGGMPAEECWDTYVRRSSGNGNPNGVLDVYGSYYPLGTGNNQTQGKTPGQTFWEQRNDGSVGIYQGFGAGVTCLYPVFYLYLLLYGSGNANSPASNEFALEYVNDLSIAIDPYQMNQLGMIMGPYSGVMTIKNWSAGSTITFGQTARNMGNPFFDECGGGIFNERNEVVQPNPPAPLRKIHLSSHDPADKELLKNKYSSLRDIEFEDDTYKDFIDEDYSFEDDLNTRISDFSTDTDNLFNG